MWLALVFIAFFGMFAISDYATAKYSQPKCDCQKKVKKNGRK